LSEFRRASDDFKRTWAREVNLENVEKGSSHRTIPFSIRRPNVFAPRAKPLRAITIRLSHRLQQLLRPSHRLIHRWCNRAKKYLKRMALRLNSPPASTTGYEK